MIQDANTSSERRPSWERTTSRARQGWGEAFRSKRRWLSPEMPDRRRARPGVWGAAPRRKPLAPVAQWIERRPPEPDPPERPRSCARLTNWPRALGRGMGRTCNQAVNIELIRSLSDASSGSATALGHPAVAHPEALAIVDLADPSA